MLRQLFRNLKYFCWVYDPKSRIKLLWRSKVTQKNLYSCRCNCLTCEVFAMCRSDMEVYNGR